MKPQPDDGLITPTASTSAELLTGEVSADGITLTTSDGMKYKFKRSNKKYKVFECAHSRQVSFRTTDFTSAFITNFSHKSTETRTLQ